MSNIHNYKDLQVWQKSRILVKEIYQISSKFPADKKFGLTTQIGRTADKVCKNTTILQKMLHRLHNKLRDKIPNT